MLATGSQIAGYHIERVLGRGGMGTVYLATQLSLNRLVALKMLSRDLADDVAFRSRFSREGEVQAALDHPHIVPVHEAGESEEGLFIAMRYVRGPTLKELIGAGELDPARTIRLLTPIAGALDSAHAAGLIHRDVKPQNILIDVNDWPYLADFGLTRAHGTVGLTRTGHLVGTFDYIAPEQVQGLPASAQTDQYALAAVLFECLAGEVPYPSESDAALLYAQVHEDPPSISDRAGDVPPAFNAVVQRGMAKNPDDRFPSAGAMMAAADAALSAGAAPEAATAARDRATPEAAPAPRSSASHPPQARGRETVISAPATPVPASRQGAGRTPRVPSAALPLAAGALAIVGFLVGSAVGSGDNVTAHTLNAGGLATLSVSAAPHSVAVPKGLGLSNARAYAIGTAGASVLVTGQGRAAGPRLLPAGAIDDAASGARATPVRVGSAEGLRFEGLRVAGLPGRGTAVAIPAASATSVALCSGVAAADRDRCARALGSLKLRAGANAVEVAPPTSYGRDLRSALTAYAGGRAAAQKELREAGRASSQAAAAGRLAAVAATLQSRVRKLDAHPAAARTQTRIAAAAADVGQAARALAAAARRGDNAAYRRAGRQLGVAERRLRSAVAEARLLRTRS